MFGSWQGPEVAAFWTAIGALSLALGSLMWQFVTWRRSGAVVRVTVVQSFPVFGQVAGDPHVCVTAENRGRGPATVTSWGFETPDGDGLFDPSPVHWSARLPFTLEAGGAPGQWFAETQKIVEGCADNGLDPARLRAWVRLGSGKKVYAKNRGIGIKMD